VADVIVPPLATKASLGSAFDGEGDVPPAKKGKPSTTTIVLRSYNQQSKEVLRSMNEFKSKFDVGYYSLDYRNPEQEMRARTCTPFEQYQLAVMQMNEMNAKKRKVTSVEKKADDGVKR